MERAVTTVLVVDDEPTLRSILVDVLVDEGYAVVTARDGQEALEIFARDAPDLVLMDVMMPRMDGPTAVRALRALPNGTTVPIVLASAVMSSNGVDLGIDGFLRKPFELDDLLQLIGRLVDVPGSV
jgi:two-component system response regulator MprA